MIKLEPQFCRRSPASARRASPARSAYVKTVGYAILITALLAEVYPACGLSTAIQLTAEKIHSDFSFILVRSKSFEDEKELRHFRVIVQPTRGVDPSNFRGSLSLFDSSSNIVSSCEVVSTRLPEKSREVAKDLRERSIVFEFSVSSHYLENSKFFVTEQLKNVPSVTAYWFRLKDYAMLETKAAPGK